MRGIAAARVAEAHAHLDSVRAYAGTIGAGIGTVLGTTGDGGGPSHVREGRAVAVLIAAEQGFAGSFNDKVFEAAAPLLSTPHDLVVIGERAILAAQDRGLAPTWCDGMIAHPAQATHLANRIGTVLFDRLAHGGARRVWIVHALPGPTHAVSIEARPLIPFDYARFPIPENARPPRLTLPADMVLARLVEDYIFAELTEAILLSFAAENEARMRAMIAAHDNVMDSLQDLVATARRMRQDEITEEIVELASGSLLAR